MENNDNMYMYMQISFNLIDIKKETAYITSEIKRLCQKKKRAWDAGKHNRNSYQWNRYLKLSDMVKDSI